MKLSAFKLLLEKVNELTFVLPDGSTVPKHFHITEAGLTTKHFIDCGGTERLEKNITFQIWTANDFDHRLEPSKLQKIITMAEPLFREEDCEIEFEFQSETICRYGLEFQNNRLLLTTKHTDCLAKDQCFVKPKLKLSDLQSKQTACSTPDSGCCS